MTPEFETFINDVFDMRQKQLLYFRDRCQVILQESKCLEAHIDRMIIKFRAAAEGQQDLFEDQRPANEKGCKDD